MDNFTPPSTLSHHLPTPSGSTTHSHSIASLSEHHQSHGDNWRAQSTDNMPEAETFPARQNSNSPPSPDTDRPARSRRGSFKFLSRSKSRTRDIPVVTSPDGHKMFRKQKLHDQEERLRQMREEKPPTLPSPSPLPNLRNTFGINESREDLRPDSISIISGRATASNFSRPYQPRTTNMPSSASPPNSGLTGLSQSPLRGQSQQEKSAMTKNGECVATPTQRRSDSITDRHHSLASNKIDNVNSPRRVRRRKDPTPFK